MWQPWHTISSLVSGQLKNPTSKFQVQISQFYFDLFCILNLEVEIVTQAGGDKTTGRSLQRNFMYWLKSWLPKDLFTARISASSTSPFVFCSQNYLNKHLNTGGPERHHNILTTWNSRMESGPGYCLGTKKKHTGSIDIPSHCHLAPRSHHFPTA